MGLKEDIKEYMGIPYEDVVQQVEKVMGNSWNGTVPMGMTKSELWDYYMSAHYSAFLFWQAANKIENNEPGVPQVLADVLKSTLPGYVLNGKLFIPERRILDFGCGCGMMDLALRSMNCEDITLADFPHKYNGFLKFISDKYELGFKFIPIKQFNEYPVENEYEFIICNEVPEQIWEQEVLLLHLYNHLVPLGYIYLNQYSLPVSSYRYPELKIIEDMGLKPAFKDKNGVWRIFQKV